MTALITVYCVLAGATVLAWAIDGNSSNAQLAWVVLAMAIVKVRFICRWFMEIREAPRAMQVALDAYLVVIACVLLIGYTAG